MSNERRKAKRIPLDSLFFVEVLFNNGNLITGLVIDVSRGGLMIGLPPAALESNEPKINDKGIIKEVSPELACALDPDLKITVMWVREGHCGLAFEHAQPKIDQHFKADNFE